MASIPRILEIARSTFCLPAWMNEVGYRSLCMQKQQISLRSIRNVNVHYTNLGLRICKVKYKVDLVSGWSFWFCVCFSERRQKIEDIKKNIRDAILVSRYCLLFEILQDDLFSDGTYKLRCGIFLLYKMYQWLQYSSVMQTLWKGPIQRSCSQDNLQSAIDIYM